MAEKLSLIYYATYQQVSNYFYLKVLPSFGTYCVHLYMSMCFKDIGTPDLANRLMWDLFWNPVRVFRYPGFLNLIPKKSSM